MTTMMMVKMTRREGWRRREERDMEEQKADNRSEEYDNEWSSLTFFICKIQSVEISGVKNVIYHERNRWLKLIRS